MGVKAEVRTCEGCGSEHIGPRCATGTRWIDRLRSVKLDPRATPTSNRNYFDAQVTESVFGADSAERLLDETKGVGAVRTDPQTGESYHQNRHSKEWERLDDATIDKVFIDPGEAE